MVTTMAALAGIAFLAVVGAAGYFLFAQSQGVALAQEGDAAIRTENYEMAIARCNAALKKPISNSWRRFVHYNRGRAFFYRSRFDESIADFTEAIRFDSSCVTNAYAARAWSYQKKGDAQKALADLDAAIRCDPNSAWAYYDRGWVRFNRQEYDEALRDFDEAARCDEHPAKALLMRGRCCLAQNDFDRALASFDGAIAVDPTNATAYEERSHLYGQRQEYDKRDRDHLEARRRDPNIDNAWQNSWTSLGEWQARPWSREFSSRNRGKKPRDLQLQAHTELDAGHYDEAIALYNDLLIMDVSAAWASSATMDRGSAYAAKGDQDKALRDYDEAIRLDPKNSGAYVDRGLLRSKQRKHKEAQNDFDEALRLNAKQWQAYFDRAGDFGDDGKLDEAIADFSKAIDLNPSFARSYVGRGRVYAQKGEIGRALGDYDKALSLDPNLSDAHLVRAFVYIRKHQYSEARRDLQGAETVTGRIAASTLNSIAWLHATSSELELRDGKKAVEAACQACEITEWKHWEYIDTLAAAYAEVGDFAQAIQCQQQALNLAPPSHPHFSQAQERLSLYRKREPYREKPKW